MRPINSWTKQLNCISTALWPPLLFFQGVWGYREVRQHQYQVSLPHTNMRPGFNIQDCTSNRSKRKKKKKKKSLVESVWFIGFMPTGSTVSVTLLVTTCSYCFYFLWNCYWYLLRTVREEIYVNVCRKNYTHIYINTYILELCTPHLHQSLLHSSPVGNPPSTLEHQIRVWMAFRLAVFSQRFPLVQFLRTAKDKGDEKFSKDYIFYTWR